MPLRHEACLGKVLKWAKSQMDAGMDFVLP